MKMSTTTSISNFKLFIKENKYYVDKTLLIDELFNKGDQVTLLPRPRRFGKTLNLSMLEYYFDINENNKDLFKGLNIEKKEIFNKHINKYPTIYLTLKEIKGLTWDKIYGDLKFAISNLYKEYKYLLESDKLESYDKDIIYKIIKREADIQDYENSLYLLSQYLYKHYGKEVIILLDEYDTPINNNYNKDAYDDIVGFMKVFIGSAFKGNNYLYKGVITGILTIAKESFFSGANNIMVRNILDNDFSDKFGFTEEEVIKALKYYNLEDEIDDVRNWYNGYTFGNNTIYNPFSIANFLQKRTIEDYWSNSGDPTLIKDLLVDADTDIKESLEQLIKGNSIEEEVKTDIVFNELNDSRYLWNLLLFSGYLKAYKIGEDKYRLSIPNEEVKKSYKSIIKGYFNKLSNNSLKIIKGIENNNIELLKEGLSKIIINMLSNHDTLNENSYHMFMMGLLAYLDVEYIINSNRESGHGRYDIAIIPKDKNRVGYIIEIKVAKENESLEEKAKEGINQIKNKEYLNDLINREIKNIMMIGIAFEGKKLYILDEKYK